MIFESITIQGYRVFANPRTVPIGPSGITCLAGRNNVGKTTALQAFGLLIRHAVFPNRKVAKELPEPTPISSDSLIEGHLPQIDITFRVTSPKVSLREITRFVLGQGATSPQHAWYESNVKIRQSFAAKGFQLTFSFKSVAAGGSYILRLDKIIIDGNLFIAVASTPAALEMPWSAANTIFSHTVFYQGPVPHGDYPEPISEITIYLAKALAGIREISAQRLVRGILPMGPLDTQVGADLATTTSLLSVWKEAEPPKFSRVVRFLKEIDDSIGDIRFVPGPNGERRVALARDREETNPTVFLNNAGSGIQHLVGMVVGIVNDEKPRLYLFDEPQAFLHPDAERALVKLMIQSEHQFIVATHSPVIVRAAGPNLVVFAKQDRQVEIYPVENPVDSSDPAIGHLAKEIGLPVSAILGSSGILWVEGPTEEAAIKEMALFEMELQNLLAGILVIALPNTGLITSTSNKTVTRALTLAIRKSMGVESLFLLDRETLNARGIEKLREEMPNQLFFIDRIEFEDYLLDSPASIHRALARTLSDANSEAKIPPLAEIEKRIIAERKGKKTAMLLNDLFQDYQAGTYDKIRHGREIVFDICRVGNGSLVPYRDVLCEVLKRFFS